MSTEPKNLYKYLSKPYADLMLTKGSLRIGTLFSYRKDEISARQDKDEGTKTTFTEPIVFDASNIPDQLKMNKIIKIEGGAKVHFKTYTEHVPNAFVYCTSREYSKVIMSSFQDCNSCVEINNWKILFQIIGKKLYDMGLISLPGMVNDCDYSGRRYTGENMTSNPYFLKDTSYGYQKEIRFVLPARKKEIDSVVIECPEIISFLKLIE